MVAIAVGCVVVLVVLDDLVQTVLSPGGGGGILTRGVGRAVGAVPRWVGAAPGSLVRRAVGPSALVGTVTVWLVGLVAGFTLLMLGLGAEHLRTTPEGMSWEPGMARTPRSPRCSPSDSVTSSR